MKFLIVLITFVSLSLRAADNNSANLIAIGQGISSPNLTSTVNYSSGYNHESPVGVVYQDSWRLTGEYDKNDTTNGYGGELGYGTGRAGIAGGYYTHDCKDCKGTAAGSAAVVAADIGVGIRYQEDLYTGALLFNPHGRHRLGLIAEIDNSGTTGNHVQNYGAGYAYVASQWTFAVDASKQNFENSSTYSNRLLITPGVMVRADFLQLSVNDKITLHNKDSDGSTNDDTTQQLWVGVGVGGKQWHLVGYVHYVNDFALALSFFF